MADMGPGMGEEEDDTYMPPEEDDLLLEPPDPVDLLIAATEDGPASGPRPMDFVRVKLQALKKENRTLRDRVQDLEQTLSIVQTAQEWTVGKGMTQEQADKMREIKQLLEQAARARAEMQNFSSSSRSAMYEKLRCSNLKLKRERQEKMEMKDRLLAAFDHGRQIKEQNRRLITQREVEEERWNELIRDTKERHRRELRRLQGEGAVMSADRTDQLSHFGEQVIQDLASLQQHLATVKQETVDTVILEDDGEGDEGNFIGGPPGFQGGDDGGGDEFMPGDGGYDGPPDGGEDSGGQEY